MTPTFNLVSEQWIPVTTKDRTACTVSLRELFHRAPELVSVGGDIATQELPIMRLLLAILYRAAGKPLTAKLWQRFWDEGLPVEDIDAYLDGWSHRFDLLDPVAPFYQVAGLHDGKNNTENRLAALVQDVDINGGTFSQRQSRHLTAVGFAEAARWLLHVQTFNPQGIATAHGGGRAYGSQVGWGGHIGPVLLAGESLSKTLLLNLPAQHPEVDWDVDLPVWERPARTPVRLAKNETVIVPDGPAHLYTWHARQLLLIHDGHRVVNALVAGDSDLRSKVNLDRFEAMTAWARSAAMEKTLKLPIAYLPRRHRAEKAMWRSLPGYLPPAGHRDSDGSTPVLIPGTVKWLARLRAEGRINPAEPIRIKSLGVIYGPNDAVYSATVADSLPLPLALLHPGLASMVEDAVRVTEDCMNRVRLLEADLAEANSSQPLEKRDTSPAEAEGYSLVDGPFRAWLDAIGPSSAPHDAYLDWCRTLWRTLATLGDDLVDRAGPGAWTGVHEKNASVASNTFRRRLIRLLGPALQRKVPS